MLTPVECPECKAVNIIGLTSGKARWFRRIPVKCQECGDEYRVRIDPKSIRRHYELRATTE